MQLNAEIKTLAFSPNLNRDLIPLFKFVAAASNVVGWLFLSGKPSKNGQIKES